LGNAIAALAFTFAIQQLVKPIYRFRLRAYGLKLIYLSGAIFAGAVCSLVAMALPNLPISHEGPFEYPMCGSFSAASSLDAPMALPPLYRYGPRM